MFTGVELLQSLKITNSYSRLTEQALVSIPTCLILYAECQHGKVLYWAILIPDTTMILHCSTPEISVLA